MTDDTPSEGLRKYDVRRIEDTKDNWWEVTEDGEGIALADEEYARRIAAALSASLQESPGIDVERVLWPAGANWSSGKRQVIVELKPIGKDGLCTGCGVKPTRETGSCGCLPRVARLLSESGSDK